mgnify:FL=1
MIVVGFGHRSRVGKDTCANLLKGQLRLATKNKRIEKASLAWSLKLACFEIYGWAGLQRPEYYDHPDTEHFRDVVLEPIGLTPVQLWIEFGNKIREIYPDTWINYLLNRYASIDVLIVPDVRFDNEIDKITLAGGLVYRVLNSRAIIRNSVSDNALQGSNKFFADIHNEGEIGDLYKILNDTVLPAVLERLK